MEVIYTNKFLKLYKKIPVKIKLLAEKKESVFRNNPNDVRLKTHALSGELDGRYSFSVNYQYRIVFRYSDNENIYFLAIGTHEIYK